METDPLLAWQFLVINVKMLPVTFGVVVSFFILVLLLLASALISGSEVACFSLTPTQLNKIKARISKNNTVLLQLLERPQNLLATILITNNFVNVAIVILSAFISAALFDFSAAPILGFIFQVVVVTFLLLLFGEIIPKVYASHSPVRFALFMAIPLKFLEFIFRPLSSVLIRATSLVNKQFSKNAKKNISMDDLSHALDITGGQLKEDKKILKGIVKFGNIDAKGIIKPRVDVVAVDIETSYTETQKIIVDSGYSRIPVFEESFDNIKGVLYLKDLLPHIDKDDTFEWQKLIRPPYFVPESKKINDLLNEFQTKKIHMAIVIDEYGGTNGIVTLEDILEEVVGEINDEFDENELEYTKLDDKTYIFEGKTQLNDFYKIMQINDDIFDIVKGDSETLAGLILELQGEFPQKNQVFNYKDFEFKIMALDKRRIKKIKVTVK